ncbi:MAG: hypothetical protein V3V01_07245 [Acidimicrobiales bacterium]
MAENFPDQRASEIVAISADQLERRVAERITAALEVLPRALATSCYGLSLVLHENESDPARFRVDVRLNTEAQVAGIMYEGVAPDEARWSLDHWVDVVLWDLDATNPMGDIERQLNGWLSAERRLHGELVGEQGRRFVHRIREVLGRVGAILHDSGSIERVFGRSVPVIVQGPESGPWAKEITAHANPWASKTERRKWFAAA